MSDNLYYSSHAQIFFFFRPGMIWKPQHQWPTKTWSASRPSHPHCISNPVRAANWYLLHLSWVPGHSSRKGSHSQRTCHIAVMREVLGKTSIISVPWRRSFSCRTHSGVHGVDIMFPANTTPSYVPQLRLVSTVHWITALLVTSTNLKWTIHLIYCCLLCNVHTLWHFGIKWLYQSLCQSL